MINRDSRGRPYSIVRGEILGFIEDELLRKHSARMFSLISERKLGDRRDKYDKLQSTTTEGVGFYSIHASRCTMSRMLVCVWGCLELGFVCA